MTGNLRGVSTIFVIVTVAVGLVLLASVIVLLVNFEDPRRTPPPLSPPSALPGPKLPLSCNVTGIAQPSEEDEARELTSLDRQGTITGSTIRLPLGRVIRMSGDLTLVALGDLVVEGKIFLPANGPPATLTLVSLQGTVKIESTAVVGDSPQRPGPGVSVTQGQDAQGIGPAGRNGGLVRLIGKELDILGKVLGQEGQESGPTVVLSTQGSAFAVGGGGGQGGDVLLCARLTIHLGRAAQVFGGEGGSAFFAQAQAGGGGVAFAQGGPGAGGRDVVFQVGSALRDPPTQCRVTVDLGAELRGGNGGGGGNGLSYGGDAVDKRGGPAFSRAEAAGSGGTVRVGPGVIFVQQQGRVAAGNGGDGSESRAEGGKGGSYPVLRAYRGGIARAEGGPAGPAGLTPRIPLGGGQGVDGTAGVPGRGGDGGRESGHASHIQRPFRACPVGWRALACISHRPSTASAKPSTERSEEIRPDCVALCRPPQRTARLRLRARELKPTALPRLPFRRLTRVFSSRGVMRNAG